MSDYDFLSSLAKENALRGGASDDAFSAAMDSIAAKKARLEEATQRKAEAFKRADAMEARRQELLRQNPIGSAIRGGFVDSDLARAVSAGAISTGGMLLGGLDRALDAADNRDRLDGLSPEEANAKVNEDPGLVKSMAQWFDTKAQESREEMNLEAKAAINASTPTGDIGDPSSWSFGRDPSLYGYALQGAEVAGQLAVPIAGALGKGATAVRSATLGSLMVAGDQAQDTEKYIDGLSDAELSKFSPDFSVLRDQGYTTEAARAIVKERAGDGAALAGAVLGIGGGLLTKSLIKDLPRNLSGNLLAKGAKGVAIGSGSEGAQEVGEVLAGRAAANLAVEGNRDIDEGTFGDFVLGSMGGATTSTVGEIAEGGQARKERREAKEAEKVEKDIQENVNVSKYVRGKKLKIAAGFEKLEALAETAEDKERKRKIVAEANELIKLKEGLVAERKKIVKKFSPEEVAKRETKKAKLLTEREKLESSLKTATDTTRAGIEDKLRTTNKSLTDLEEEIKGFNSLTPEQYEVERAKVLAQDLEVAALRSRRDALHSKLLPKSTNQATVSTKPASIPKPEMTENLSFDFGMSDEVAPTSEVGADTAVTAPVETAITKAAKTGNYTAPAVAMQDSTATSATASTSLTKTGSAPTRSAMTILQDVTSKADDTDAVERSKKAPEELIEALASESESLDLTDLAEIKQGVNSPNNILSSKQRGVINAMIEARETLLSNMELVSRDVLKGNADRVKDGDKKFKGVEEYRKAFYSALKSDPTGVSARAEMEGLRAFQEHMHNKAETVKKAFGIFKSTGESVPVMKAGNQWIIADSQDNADLIIAANSWKLLNSIAADQKVVTTTFRELNGAYQYATGKKAVIAGGNSRPVSQGTSNAGKAGNTRKGKGKDNSKGRVSAARGTGKDQQGTGKPPAKSEGQQGKDPSAPVQYSFNFGEIDDGNGNQVPQDLEFNGLPTGQAAAVTSSTTPNNGLAKAVSTTFAEDIEAPEKAKGTLRIFRKAEELKEFVGKVYKENFVSRFFKQRVGDTEGSVRPLVAIEDFITKFNKGEIEDISQFIKDAGLLTEKAELVKLFADYVPRFNELVKKNLADPSAKELLWHFQNPAVKFNTKNPDGSVSVDENFLTAVSYAVFEALVDSFKNSVNNPNQMRKIAGLDSKERLLPEITKNLRYAGTPQTLFGLGMAETIIDVLGLTPTNNKVPMDAMDTLKASLAGLAINVIKDTGFMESHKVSLDANERFKKMTFMRIKQDNTPVNKDWPTQTILPNNPKLKAEFDKILKVSKDSKNVLEKLMSHEPRTGYPSFKPKKFVQEVAKRTKMLIPSWQAEVLDAENKKAHVVLVEQTKAFFQLPIHIQESLAGVVDLEGKEETMHKSEYETIEAQNDGLRRELENLRNWVETLEANKDEDGNYPPFYLEREVTRVQRVQLKNSVINPQLSKIHRYLIGMPEWVSDIEINIGGDDKDRAKKEKILNSFKLRVVEGIGQKTEKNRSDDSLYLFNRLYAEATNPKTGLGKAMVSLNKDPETWTFEDHSLINAAVADQENMYTYAAMYALRDYINAAKGNGKFSTSLIGQVDGVTNGPMLALQWLGAQSSKFMERGGFFAIADAEAGEVQYKNHNEWIADGNKDLYETVAEKVLEALSLGLNKVFPTPDARTKHLTAASNLLKYAGGFAKLGSVDGSVGVLVASNKGLRDFVKQPVTSTVFGSGLEKIMTSMTKEVTYNLYTALSRISDINSLEGQRDYMVQWFQEVNQIFEFHNSNLRKGQYPVKLLKPSDFGKSVNEIRSNLLNFQFSPAQQEAIGTSFSKIFKPSFKEAIDGVFGEFIKKRNALNEAAQASFYLYRSVYLAMKKEALEVMDAYRIGKNNTPIHDITYEMDMEIREKIKHLLPSAATASAELSTTYDEARDYRAGIYYGKNETTYSTAGNTLNVVQVPTKTGRNLELSPGFTSEVDSGVAPLITLIHSSDSAIAMSAYSELFALNLHDAIATGVADIDEAAKRLNKATYRAMLMYSVPSAMYESYERVLTGVNKFYSEMSPESQKAFRAELKSWADKRYDEELERATRYAKKDGLLEVKFNPETYFEEVLDNAFTVAKDADITNYTHLAQMAYVNQYSFENGFYEVTDQDRAYALEQLQKAEAREIAKDNFDAAAAMSKMFDKANRDIIRDTGNAVPKKEYKSTLTDAPKLSKTTAMRASPKSEKGKANKAAWQAKGLLRGRKKAVLEAEPEWTVFFNEHASKPINGKELVVQAIKVLKAKPQTKHGNFMLALLEAAKGFNLEDIEVVVTTANDPLDAYPEEVWDSAGFFSRTGIDSLNGNQRPVIGLKNDQFLMSGFNTETIVHEIVHAVTAQGLERLLNADRDTLTQAELDLVDGLKELFEASKEYVEANKATNPALNKFSVGYGLSSMYEFLSVGYSDKEFILNVLMPLKISSIPEEKSVVLRKSKIRTAFDAFIQKLHNILFGKRAENADVTALDEFVRITVGLMDATAKAGESEVEGTDSKNAQVLSNSVFKRLTTEQLFDSIGRLGGKSVSVSHEKRLRGVLQAIVANIREPYEIFNQETAASNGVNADEHYIQTLANGQRPFVSTMLASGFSMAPQTSFVLEQVEAVLRALVESKDIAPKAFPIYTELDTIYREARNMLSPADFHKAFKGTDYANASDAEKETAKQMYEYVFTESSANGASDPVTRFAAMATALPEFSEMLSYDNYKTEKKWKDMNWPERIRSLVDQAMSVLSNTVRMSWAAPDKPKAHIQVAGLIDNLVAIENRRRNALSRSPVFNKNAIDAFGKDVRNKALKTVGKLSTSKYVAFRAIGGLANVSASNNAELFLQHVEDVKAKMFPGLPSVLGGIMHEVEGMKDRFNDLIRFAKLNENARHDMAVDAEKNIKQAFRNGGAEITEEMEVKLTKVFLQPATFDLVGAYNLGQIQAMLADPKVLKQEILNQERKLRNTRHELAYLRQAKDLAHYLITEDVRNRFLLRNAHNIARLAGMDTRVDPIVAAEVEPVIDVLVSLYALTEVHIDTRREMADFMLTEMHRTDGNGIEYLMAYTKKLQGTALEKLFQGNKSQTLKGYYPQILDEGMDIKAATLKEGEELEKRGWVRGNRIVLDSADPDKAERYLYTLVDRGSLKWVTGAVSLTSNKSRGTKQHGTFFDPVTGAIHRGNYNKFKAIDSKKKDALAEILNTPRSYKPDAREKANYMLPLISNEGEVINYVYQMSGRTKDGIMGRDLRVSKVLGKYTATNFDKETAPKQNRVVVEALKAQYDEDYATRPHTYVEIGPRATNPELAEVWKLLPPTMKKDIKEVWGRDSIFVPAKVARQIFGFRELSIVSPLLKSDAERKKTGSAEKVYVSALEAIYKTATGKDAGTAGLAYRRIGVAVEELNTWIKDVFVIRRGLTLVGNVFSNYTQLWANGLSLAEAISLTHKYSIAALEYDSLIGELNSLKAMKESGYTPTTPQQLEQGIIELERRIERNPVTKFVKAGLKPTIVDDVSLVEEDPYSFKSKLLNKADSVTNRIPSGIKTVSKYLMVSPDTPLYKVLHQGTQLSDFVARLAMVHHLTTRKEEPMSEQDAIRKAYTDFVVYDKPTHPVLHWLDSVGLTRFTKYYLRIQMPILRLMRDKPARMLALILASNYLDGVQTLWDSSLRFSNPFEGSVLDVFDASNDPLLMKATQSLVGF